MTEEPVQVPSIQGLLYKLNDAGWRVNYITQTAEAEAKPDRMNAWTVSLVSMTDRCYARVFSHITLSAALWAALDAVKKGTAPVWPLRVEYALNVLATLVEQATEIER